MPITFQRKYKVIGLMSGTSLDGVDISYCYYSRKEKKWRFALQAAQTVRYTPEWKKNLSQAHLLSSEELLQLHVRYGKFLGTLVNQFIKQKKIKEVDFISSHGHTVFHRPKNGFTFQLGDGNSIHAATRLPVVYDFRSLDVTLGGEGAPLVPIGDQLLFSKYDGCLNLGGIANLSMQKKGKRIAFDICFCNMALNYLTAKAGYEFDKNGAMAEQGKINDELLQRLINGYSKKRNKKPSLAREGFQKNIQPLLDDDSISLNDRLATVCESIAHEISSVLPPHKMKILITGGGALNDFLVTRMADALSEKIKLIMPPKNIIDFKEAIIFGFLGVLRTRNETNVLKSVTGATNDSCSGILVG